MRLLALPIGILFVGFMGTVARADEPTFSPDEREAIAASEARAEAFNHRDVTAYQRFLAKARLVTNPDGKVIVAPPSIPALKDMPPADDQFSNLRNYQALTVGDVVVLSHVFDEHEKFGPTDIVSKVAQTEVWTRRSDRWVLVAVANTSIPVNHRPAIAVDPSKLAQYAGRYEWRPGFVDEMSVQGDHLVSRTTGSDPDPTYFAAPDVSVASDDLGEAVFQRNVADQVTGYLFRGTDGQTLLARKLP